MEQKRRYTNTRTKILASSAMMAGFAIGLIGSIVGGLKAFVRNSVDQFTIAVLFGGSCLLFLLMFAWQLFATARNARIASKEARGDKR